MRSRFPEIPGYTLLREIGRGGMGVVYLARRAGADERPFAIKILQRDVNLKEKDLARFQREGEVGRGLVHPNILPVIDVVATEESLAIVLPFVQGHTLAERLTRAEGGAEPRERLRRNVHLLAQVADALDHAHRHGIVHRDVKPSNVLVRDADQHPYLIDFGLARASEAATLTSTGDVFGTPNYMAPEQFVGDLALIGPHTDVYGLGSTLFELAAGQPPFKSASVERLLPRVLNEEPPRLGPLAPHAPKGLEAVILRALEKKPEHRYANGGELRDDLLRVLRGAPPSGGVTVARRRFLRGVTRQRLKLAAGLIVVLLALLGAGFAYVAREDRQSRERDIEFSFVRGNEALSDGDLTAAIRHFDEAAARDPKRGDVYLWKAVAFDEGERWNERNAAIRAAEVRGIAFDTEPESGRDYLTRGLLKIGRGEYEAAAGDLRRAVDLDRTLDAAWLRLARLEVRLGRSDEAVRCLETYLGRLPASHEQRPMLESYVDEWRGDYEAARTRLAAALEAEVAEPLRGRLMRRIGLICAHLGRFDEAEDLLLAATEADPQDAAAWVRLGSVYAARKRFREAEQCADKARAIAPHLSEAATLLGGIAFATRATATPAREVLRRALRDATDAPPDELFDATMHYDAAMRYLEAGDPAAMSVELHRCLELDPQHLGALTELGIRAWGARDFAAAYDLFVRAEKTWDALESLREGGLKGWRRDQRDRGFLRGCLAGLLMCCGELGRIPEGLAARDKLVSERGHAPEFTQVQAWNAFEALAANPVRSLRDEFEAGEFVRAYDLDAFASGRPEAEALLEEFRRAVAERAAKAGDEEGGQQDRNN